MINKDASKLTTKLKISKKVSSKRLYQFSVQILSLLGAIVLWFYVMGANSPSYEKEFTEVPVSIVGGDVLKEKHGYTVLSGTDAKIDIKLKGRKSEILKLRTLDLQVQADVSAIDSVGEQTCTLNTVLPSSIVLVSMSSTDISVYIDKSVSKSVPVKVTHTGYINTGLILGIYQPSPTSVLVEGPENIINKIDGAYVDLKLDEINGSVRARQTLVLKDKDGNLISNPYVNLRTKEADVYIPVYQEKTIPLKVSFVDGLVPITKANISISPSAILVRGLVEEIPKLQEIIFDVHEGQIDGVYQVKRTINLPAGIENKSGATSAAISITLPEISSRTMRLDNIEYKNKPNGLEYNVAPISSAFDIKLKGETAALLNFEKESISAFVDLSELKEKTPGIYQLPVSIDTNKESTGVYLFGVYYVDIEVLG